MSASGKARWMDETKKTFPFLKMRRKGSFYNYIFKSRVDKNGCFKLIKANHIKSII